MLLDRGVEGHQVVPALEVDFVQHKLPPPSLDEVLNQSTQQWCQWYADFERAAEMLVARVREPDRLHRFEAVYDRHNPNGQRSVLEIYPQDGASITMIEGVGADYSLQLLRQRLAEMSLDAHLINVQVPTDWATSYLNAILCNTAAKRNRGTTKDHKHYTRLYLGEALHQMQLSATVAEGLDTTYTIDDLNAFSINRATKLKKRWREAHLTSNQVTEMIEILEQPGLSQIWLPQTYHTMRRRLCELMNELQS